MSKHTAVLGYRRFAVADNSATIELAALIAIGVATAIASAYVKLNLGIGGHAIVLTAIPTMLGMSAFPRRFAGATIAGSAIATALVLRAGGASIVGPAALAAFAATGLFGDLVLARAKTGWQVYAGLVIAGLLANVVAFGAHLIETTARVVPGVSSATPWPIQIASYAACGAAAGFASAAIAFQLRARR